MALGGRSFNYLGAERQGPRDSQSTFPGDPLEMVVGSKGEFLAHFLAQLERLEVRVPLRHPTAKGETATLIRQSEYWMADILAPVEIDAQWIPGANVANIRFKTPGVRKDWVRPANFGFGFSVCLPIVVASLAAADRGLLMVENPEAHLHPRAQSRLGRFLALVAAHGVQVIIETHSDHVVNGVRRAVVDQLGVSGRDVLIHFFGDEDRPRTLEVTPKGSVSAWPPGFFDQMEIDLAQISGLRRK